MLTYGSIEYTEHKVNKKGSVSSVYSEYERFKTAGYTSNYVSYKHKVSGTSNSSDTPKMISASEKLKRGMFKMSSKAIAKALK